MSSCASACICFCRVLKWLPSQVQKRLEQRSKKLGWGDRLEAAAQAAELEVSSWQCALTKATTAPQTTPCMSRAAPESVCPDLSVSLHVCARLPSLLVGASSAAAAGA